MTQNIMSMKASLKAADHLAVASSELAHAAHLLNKAGANIRTARKYSPSVKSQDAQLDQLHQKLQALAKEMLELSIDHTNGIL